MLTPEEQKELAELEKEFGNAPEAQPSGLTAEEQKELAELEKEFGQPKIENSQVEKDRRMAKAQGQLEQARKENPKAFTETGEVAPVEIRNQPGLAESAAGFVGESVTAAGLGAADALTASFADEAVGLVGGDKAKENVRTVQKFYGDVAPEATLAGQIGGAVGGGIGAGATKLGAKLAAKEGAKGLAARTAAGASYGATEAIGSSEDMENLGQKALKGAALGTGGAVLGEAIGAGAKALKRPAVAKQVEKATKKVDDIKKSITKVWKDQGPDGQYILDMMGEAGNKFRETLGLGGAAARKTKVSPLKEKVLRQKMGKIAGKLKAQVDLKSKDLKKTYQGMYKEAYDNLKGKPAIELRELPGLDNQNLPAGVREAWQDTINFTDAADQARALKEVRKQLYDIVKDKDTVRSMRAAGQNPIEALAEVNNIHSSIPGLGEADVFYRQDMELKDLVRSIGTRTQQGRRVITGETAKKLGGETEERLAARAAELPEDIGAGIQETGAEFRRAQEGLKVQPSIEEAQQRLSSQLSPEERALEEIRLQQAQEGRFGEVMHSDVIGKPDMNVRQATMGAADVAAATQTGAGGLGSRLMNMVGLGEGFEKTVRTNPGRAMLELAVAERKAQEALQSGRIAQDMYDRLVSEINTLRMGAGSGAAALGGE